MRIVQLQQGTNEWLEWRAARGKFALPDGGPRIMASEVPVIMGVSPYMTAHQLWMVKTGRMRPPALNRAMMRGHQYEPAARQKLSELLGEPLEPLCCQAVDGDAAPIWAGASLDGSNAFGSIIIEVKVPGKKDFADVRARNIPRKYAPQVQWQLLICGADKCLFAVYDPGDGVVSDKEEMLHIEVLPDPEMQRQLIEKCEAFRKAVMEDTPLAGDQASLAAVAWLRAYTAKETAEAALKAAQEQLLSIAPSGARADLPGVTITRTQRAGTVDKDAVIKALVEKYNVQPTEIEALEQASTKAGKEVVTVRRGSNAEAFLQEYEERLQEAAKTAADTDGEDDLAIPVEGDSILAW